jgi:hypothetical protein
MKMKATLKFTILTVLLICAASVAALAQNARFNASQTFEFDPENIGGVDAEWKQGIGLADRTGNKNFGLQLTRTAPTSAPVSAGVFLTGLNNVVVLSGDVFGYDIRNDSPCGGGSPRFNVSYMLPDGSEGFSFVGGCVNGTKTPAPQNPLNWTRVTFDLQNPAQTFPVIPIGAMLQSVALIVDETGVYTIDNIRFRDQFADRPGASGADPALSN